MSLTSQQIATKLFKKLQNVADTSGAKEFFEENILGRMMIAPSQIWSEFDLIPVDGLTNPSHIADAISNGIIDHQVDLQLISIPNTKAFYSPNLKDAIPFNYADGAYNYVLKNHLGGQIPFGYGDWVVDTDAGVLTFYGTLPEDVSIANPPTITFYRYTGLKGFGTVDGIVDIYGYLISAFRDTYSTTSSKYPHTEYAIAKNLSLAANTVNIGNSAYTKSIILKYWCQNNTKRQQGTVEIHVTAGGSILTYHDAVPFMSVTGSISASIVSDNIIITVNVTEDTLFKYNVERINNQ